MTKPSFQPAPRPRPRITPTEARQLVAVADDLGFNRATVGSSEVDKSAFAQEPKRAFAPSKTAALKFEVPEEVWIALRQEALNRRVTVRYLVLEALSAKGYNVDLAAVPEDGRRLR